MLNSTDPLADMLTRVRNALLVNCHQIEVPYSQLKHEVVKILAKNDFILKVGVSGQGKDKVLQLILSTNQQLTPITHLKRISKPGRRVYVGWRQIPTIKNGRGLVVMSTSQGLMSGYQARRARLGGEVLCSIY